jgi:CheY-like chemotaxis protein
MSTTAFHPGDLVDTLRLSHRQYEQVLRQIDAAQSRHAQADGRATPRLPFIGHPIVAQITQPGGSVANFLVWPRNLSATGLGFFHGSFLYTGSPCTSMLRRNDGAVSRLDGKIARCRHLAGKMHEVGVAFDHAIEVERFLSADQCNSLEATEDIQCPRHVLYLSAPELDESTTIAAQLSLFGFTLEVARSLEAAAAMMQQRPPSLILAEVEEDRSAAQRLGTGSAAATPVIALVAANRSAQDLQRFGFTGEVARPFRMEELLSTACRIASSHESVARITPAIRRALVSLTGCFRVSLQQMLLTTGLNP